MFHVGIDIAKEHHDACGVDEAGQVVLPAFRLANSRPGGQALLDRLDQLGGPGQVRLAMESTAHYWIPLYEFLTDQGYNVYLFNPLQVRAYRQVGIRKTKTDRVDSFYIADFLRIRPAAALSIPSPTCRQLRHLARFRWTLTDRATALRRRGHMLLDHVFPEYPALFARPFDGTSRTLLRQAVTAAEFRAWPVAELTAVIRQASRGRLGQEKAQQIVAAAESSLGIPSLQQVAQVEMACLLDQMALLEDQLDSLDQTLADLLPPEGHFLTTIPGISAVLAAAILGEIQDVGRFPQLKSLVAYAGLDPSVHQSGHFQATESALSKRGSPYLRRLIWLAATAARRHNPDLEAFYQRKRRQGKHHNTVMGAVCHRLLARIYVLLKEKRPFVVR